MGLTEYVPMQLVLFYLIGCLSILTVSTTVFLLSRRRNKNFNQDHLLYLFIVSLGFSLYLPVSQYFKYQELHFYVDFSHWMQILYSIVQTGKPENLSSELLIPGTLNYLSAHFVPLIYVLAVPFAIAPYAETVIYLNYLLMVSSVIPLYKLTRVNLHTRESGLFFMILLLWYPSFQYIVLYEFEMLRFSIPALLWMLYFWEIRCKSLYWISVGLAVLIREEVSLTIFMFGIYIILAEREKKPGFLTALVGFSSFLIITQTLMPALSGLENYEHVAATIFGQFGTTIPEIASGLFGQPGLVLTTISHPVKIANLVMFLFPILFLPFWAPLVLVTTFANVGVGLLSGSLAHTSYMLYYMSPSLPFIFYAVVKGWPRLVNFVETRSLCSGLTISSTLMRTTLVGIFTANIFFSPSPISLQFWFSDMRPGLFRTQNFHYSVHQVTHRKTLVPELVSLIPDEAIVAAPMFLHPRLFRKRATMVFPKLTSIDGSIKADYVFFDSKNNDLSSGSPAYISKSDFSLVMNNPDRWRLITEREGYYLYERNTP